MAKLRFLFDEHVDRAVAQQLRRRGVDVLTATEAGLRSAPDSEYLRLAVATGRVIVTLDNDFRDAHYAGHEHAGIIYCKPRTKTIGEVVTALLLFYEIVDAEEMVGHLELL